MKLLIGYDGSSSGRSLLDGLKGAGLPSKMDVVVMTVADVWLAPEKPDPKVVAALPVVGRAYDRAQKLLAEARATAAQGADAVGRLFPQAQVSSVAVADSPGWGLLAKAREWRPDLLVVGATGKSRLDRWTLGSVSHKIMNEAECSVRISRGRKEAPAPGGLRVMVALDGSPDSDRAVEMVLGRSWPEGTRVRVVAVVDDRLLSAAALRVAPLAQWMKPEDKNPADWVGRLVENACGRLVKAGLIVSGRVEKGDPKKVLVQKAERWRTDSLFLGARGLTRWERNQPGSVSTAVAGRATCGVELVRGPRVERPITTVYG